jgi:hypothetical protein
MNVDLQQYRDLKIFMIYVVPSQHVIMEFAFIMRVSNLVSIMAFLEIDAVLGNKCIAVFRVSSDPIFLYFSYVFKILLYFLYLPKISYISSQNPIFFQNYEKKSLIFYFEWKFHINITNRCYIGY